MQINFQESAYKAQIAKILRKIEKLKNYPNISNVKKLTNHYPPYRLRIGDYRVLFDAEEQEIFISYIKHRKEAY